MLQACAARWLAERLAPDPRACRESIEAYAQERFLERIGRVLDVNRALASRSSPSR